MDPTTQWHEYAACWSTPEPERSRRLQLVVDAAAVYRDPGTAISGTAALAEYMTAFEQAFPGARFSIDEVSHHHQRSLASWRQVAADGSTQGTGRSCAIHGDDGRFVDITGFFTPS